MHSLESHCPLLYCFLQIWSPLPPCRKNIAPWTVALVGPETYSAMGMDVIGAVEQRLGMCHVLWFCFFVLLSSAWEECVLGAHSTSPWMVEHGIRRTDLSSTCAVGCGIQMNCKATSENKVFVVTNPGHLGAVCYCSKGWLIHLMCFIWCQMEKKNV